VQKPAKTAGFLLLLIHFGPLQFSTIRLELV
jgi:hypothetical protein